jgi:hypothetical protein
MGRRFSQFSEWITHSEFCVLLIFLATNKALKQGCLHVNPEWREGKRVVENLALLMNRERVSPLKANTCSAGQENPCLLYSLKLHYYNPLPGPNRSFF